MFYKFEVGQKIKSFDFPGRSDCYIVGTITNINENKGILTCDVVEAISEGKEYEFPDDKFITSLHKDIFDDLFTGGKRIHGVI